MKERKRLPRKEKRRSRENSKESKGSRRRKPETKKTRELLSKMPDRIKLIIFPRSRRIFKATMSELIQCTTRSNNVMNS